MGASQAYRQSRGLSLQAFATQLGLRSKGYLHDLESGRQRWPIELALKLQRLSDGAVTVADLRPDLADVVVTSPPATPAEARA